MKKSKPVCIQIFLILLALLLVFNISFGAGWSDGYFIKTNSSGDTLWTKTFGGASDDRFYSVQQTLAKMWGQIFTLHTRKMYNVEI